MIENEELRRVPMSELLAEVKRREGIQNSKWPKPFVLILSHESDEDEAYLKFLENECGFIPDSTEYDRALGVAKHVELSCEIDSDGTTRVVGFPPTK